MPAAPSVQNLTRTRHRHLKVQLPGPIQTFLYSYLQGAPILQSTHCSSGHHATKPICKGHTQAAPMIALPSRAPPHFPPVSPVSSQLGLTVTIFSHLLDLPCLLLYRQTQELVCRNLHKEGVENPNLFGVDIPDEGRLFPETFSYLWAQGQMER